MANELENIIVAGDRVHDKHHDTDRSTINFPIDTDWHMVSKIISYNKPKAVCEKIWDRAGAKKQFNSWLKFLAKPDSPENEDLNLSSPVYIITARTGIKNIDFPLDPSVPVGFQLREENPANKASFASFFHKKICAEGVPTICKAPINFSKVLVVGTVTTVAKNAQTNWAIISDIGIVTSYKVFSIPGNPLKINAVDKTRKILIDDNLVVNAFRAIQESCISAPDAINQTYCFDLAPGILKNPGVPAQEVFCVVDNAILDPAVLCCTSPTSPPSKPPITGVPTGLPQTTFPSSLGGVETQSEAGPGSTWGNLPYYINYINSNNSSMLFFAGPPQNTGHSAYWICTKKDGVETTWKAADTLSPIEENADFTGQFSREQGPSGSPTGSITDGSCPATPTVLELSGPFVRLVFAGIDSSGNCLYNFIDGEIFMSLSFIVSSGKWELLFLSSSNLLWLGEGGNITSLGGVYTKISGTLSNPTATILCQ